MRRYLSSTLITIYIIAFLAVIGLIGVRRAQLNAPPLAYSAPAYAPEISTVCAGDTLHWHSQLAITDAPVLVTRYRTIWSLERNATVWVDPVLIYAIWTEPTTVRSNVSLLVPPLAPGIYEVRAAGQAEGTGIAYYIVRFVVRACDSE